jgi:two-component SAPR family response regulator
MLSDIPVPALFRIQLVRKVKEINPSIKVVLMTAFFKIRDNEFSKVFRSVHIDGFVQMPIRIDELTNKILSIIGETKRTLDEDCESR